MAKPKRSGAENEQLLQTVQMFEVIAETQPNDIQSLEILKEAYLNLERDADAVGVSKKIAHAYVQLCQLSSAILEKSVFSFFKSSMFLESTENLMFDWSSACCKRMFKSEMPSPIFL